MGSVILFFLCFSRFLIPLSRENKVICIARDGCTSDTGMYSSADGCIYGLCWPENSEKNALPRCPVLDFLGLYKEKKKLKTILFPRISSKTHKSRPYSIEPSRTLGPTVRQPPRGPCIHLRRQIPQPKARREEAHRQKDDEDGEGTFPGVLWRNVVGRRSELGPKSKAAWIRPSYVFLV